MEEETYKTEEIVNSDLNAVSGNLLYDKLAVIIKTKDGRIF